MRRLKTSFALLALAGAAAACTPDTNRLTPISNPSLYSANQPVVQRTDYVLDLMASGGTVDPSELSRLAAWYDTMRLRYGDVVFIDEAEGYFDPRARDDIAQVTGARGLLLVEGAPITTGAVRPGMIRVVVSRSTATVPGCPIWEDQVVGAPEQTATNYGCATNSNLASMIADPNDLVLGQSRKGLTDLRDAARAVEAYRSRANSAFKLK